MATNTYVALDKKTVTSAVGSVVFSSIPSTYTDLKLVVCARGTTSAYIAPAIAFNTDTSSTNYSWTALFGDGASGISYRVANQNVISGEQVPRSTDSAGMFGYVSFDIQNYSNTTTYKTVLVRNSSQGANGVVYAGVGLWRGTPAAINAITVTSGTPNFEVGTTFSLYGIKAQVTPGTAKASGGTITYDNSGNVIHTFTSTGTFTPSQNLTCDYLVVAGGGGGGSSNSVGSRGAGGGGAGGYRYFTSQSFTATGYAVTIGGGGASNTQGVNSSVNSTSSTGGGKGGTSDEGGANNGGAGGSGGGAGEHPGSRNGGAGNAGGYTPVEGYAGTPIVSDIATLCGAPGGGASGTATYVSPPVTPSNGATNSISGAAVVYAQGGAGGFESGGTAGANGTANTGMGGQGGSGKSSPYNNQPGGTGGSGIVIIRYSGV